MKPFICDVLMICVFIGCAMGQESKYPLLYHETFENGAAFWRPNEPENWRIVEQDGRPIYELVEKGTSGPIRKPWTF